MFVVPLVASFLVAVALSRSLPSFEPFWQRVGRWVGIAIVATIVLMLTESLLRRLLPLAALLSLTLVFPDETPSRFGIALRGMSARQLAKRLDEIDEGGLGDTPREAANTLLSLVGALSRHDRLTRGHSERVRAYSQLIGEEMELEEQQLDGLRWAGLLHDVGKMAVPPEILNKTGKLTDEEFTVIKTHPAQGRAMVAPLAGWLGDSSRAVYEHHERWAGGGYPTGVSGEHLALESRIVSVADAFDVMTSARSYKKAIPLRDARAEIQRCSGSQFDPAVVRAMMNISLGKLWRAMGPLSWVAQIGLFPRPLVAATPAASGTVAATVGAALTAASSIVPGGSVVDDRPEYVDAVVVTTTTTSPGGAGEPGEDLGSGASAGSTTAADGSATSSTLSNESAAPVGSAGSDTPVPATSTSTPTTTSTSTSTSTTTSTTSTSTSTTTAIETTSTTAAPPPPPPPTTSPPSTSPPTTSPPTTSPPPPTTTVAPPITSLSLSSPSAGDQLSQPVLELVANGVPQNPGPLPNYDIDRNDDPGLTIVSTPQGLTTTDPAGVQAWRFPASLTTLDGTLALQLWLASANTTGAGQLITRAGLFRCDDARTTCVRLAQDTLVAQPEEGVFAPFTFDLVVPPTSLAPGERFELRIALISGSQGDLWVGYDSADTPAALVLPL